MRIVGALVASTFAKAARPMSLWFSLESVSRDSVVSGDPSEGDTIGDSVYNAFAPTGGVLHEVDVVFVPSYPVTLPLVSFASSNESVATVDANGRVTRVSDGTVSITATSGGVSRSLEVTVELETDASGAWNRWANGTLAKAASDAVDSRLAGKTAAGTLGIFSTQDHNGQSYTRNPSLWCADLVSKLTCISPWNSTGGTTRAGTLITPRHIIFAEHYEIGNNATVRFVTAGGTVVNRTMTHKVRHPAVWPDYVDLTIGILDSDVPETIVPCTLPPDNFEDFFTNISRGIPALCLDQEEKALVTDLYSNASQHGFKVPSDAKRLEFYEPKIGGDSGNPAFLIVNGELVLLTVWRHGGAGSGYDIGDHLAALNEMIEDADAMAGVSTGYTVTMANLSGFPTFP